MDTDRRGGVSAGVAFELDGLALADHDGARRVVKDDRRDAHGDGHVRRNLLSHSEKHLALVFSRIILLDVFDLPLFHKSEALKKDSLTAVLLGSYLERVGRAGLIVPQAEPAVLHDQV